MKTNIVYAGFAVCTFFAFSHLASADSAQNVRSNNLKCFFLLADEASKSKLNFSKGFRQAIEVPYTEEKFVVMRDNGLWRILTSDGLYQVLDSELKFAKDPRAAKKTGYINTVEFLVDSKASTSMHFAFNKVNDGKTIQSNLNFRGLKTSGFCDAMGEMDCNNIQAEGIIDPSVSAKVDADLRALLDATHFSVLGRKPTSKNGAAFKNDQQASVALKKHLESNPDRSWFAEAQAACGETEAYKNFLSAHNVDPDWISVEVVKNKDTSKLPSSAAASNETTPKKSKTTTNKKSRRAVRDCNPETGLICDDDDYEQAPSTQYRYDEESGLMKPE